MVNTPNPPWVDDGRTLAQILAGAAPTAGATPITAEKLNRLEAAIASSGSPNVVGGRPIVAAAQAAGSLAQLRNYTAVTGQNRHLITSDCSDVRLVYSARTGGNGAANGVTPESDLSSNVLLRVGVATSSTATSWYPVTFGGKQIGELAPGFGQLVSDPVPMDLTAGSYLYERYFQWVPFGQATTLAASTLANATSFTTAALPAVTSGNFTVDTGGNLEVVEVVDVSGSGPYTCTINPNTSTGALRNKLLRAHSSGVAVYQQVFTDRIAYSDRGEFNAGYTSALLAIPMRAYSGTFSAIAASSTTLSSAATAGDRSVVLAAALNAPTLLIGTGGTQESATVVNAVGLAAPYTYYLAAPLTNGQGSGVAVTSGTTGYSGGGFGARAIVADRASGVRKPSVVVVGDSIAAGAGYNIRSATGFIDLALGGTTPVVNLGISSDKVSTFVIFDNSPGRRKWLGVADWLIIQYPQNDISNGRTLAQIQADFATIITMARNRGNKVCLMTQKPQTTSTDSWATVGNQTVVAAESVRASYNAWIRAGAGGVADLTIDVGAPLDSGLAAGGAASGKWIGAHATNGPYTSDGVHPSTIGHALMAAAINPALFV